MILIVEETHFMSVNIVKSYLVYMLECLAFRLSTTHTILFEGIKFVNRGKWLKHGDQFSHSLSCIAGSTVKCSFSSNNSFLLNLQCR